MDATIIAAPPSTKNEAQARDPEMHQTKKGKDWHFGMKAHVGTDRRGIVHSLSTTAANVHDITQMSKLLHGEEREVFGDQAYWSESHRQARTAGHPLPGQPAPQPRPPLTRIPELASTGAARPPGPGASTSFTWSSVCGASARFATAGWRRTPRGCSPPSPWRTCIC